MECASCLFIIGFKGYSYPFEVDIYKFLAATEEIPLHYSAEFCEFGEIIMIDEGLETPIK